MKIGCARSTLVVEFPADKAGFSGEMEVELTTRPVARLRVAASGGNVFGPP